MLVNKTKQPQTIKIVLADGTKDSVNVYSRVNLPPGAYVDPLYAASYSAIITDTTPRAAVTKGK